VTTFGEVIERTRTDWLTTTQREPINVLASGIDDVETGLQFSHQVRFIPGARLSVDLEDMHVVDVAGGGTGATVIRGVNGSTASDHAQGAIVRVNPTWSNLQIANAVNTELADLSSPVNGLFRIRSVEFDYIPSTAGYALTGLDDFIDIWRVRYDTPGPEDDWPIIPRSLWRIDNAADTDDFASGVQILLRAGGFPGHPVRVSYKASFDQISTDPVIGGPDADILDATGLHTEAHDILPLGAGLRLASGIEVQRGLMTTQADPRYAEDVPPRTSVSALVPLIEQREERIRSEQARLARRFPEAL
jgi:hypothetical protein